MTAISFVYPEPFSTTGRYRLNFASRGGLATMHIITFGLMELKNEAVLAIAQADSGSRGV